MSRRLPITKPLEGVDSLDPHGHRLVPSPLRTQGKTPVEQQIGMTLRVVFPWELERGIEVLERWLEGRGLKVTLARNNEVSSELALVGASPSLRKMVREVSGVLLLAARISFLNGRGDTKMCALPARCR